MSGTPRSKRRTPNCNRTRSDSALSITAQKQLILDLESDEGKERPSEIHTWRHDLYGDPGSTKPGDVKKQRALYDKIRKLRRYRETEPTEFA